MQPFHFTIIWFTHLAYLAYCTRTAAHPHALNALVLQLSLQELLKLVKCPLCPKVCELVEATIPQAVRAPSSLNCANVSLSFIYVASLIQLENCHPVILLQHQTATRAAPVCVLLLRCISMVVPSSAAVHCVLLLQQHATY